MGSDLDFNRFVVFRKKDKWWFIGMGLLQLLGIIEIYYLVKHTSFVSDVNIYLYKKLNH